MTKTSRKRVFDLDYQRKWYKENKSEIVSRQLMRRYGINLEDKERMLIEQGWACSICSKELGLHGNNSHVDHCHDTDVVRGILCSNCNTALGLLQDDVAILLRAAEYLDGP